MYEPWTHAVTQFFSRAQHGGQTVPVVFARADRAHMQLARIMKRRLQGKKKVAGETDVQPPADTVQALEDRPAPVPFLSVWMEPPVYDATRANTFHRLAVAEDRQAGTALVMKFPRPMRAQVQVDMWCGSKAGERIANNLQAQIDLRFLAESVYLPIDWTLEKWYRAPFYVPEHAKFLGMSRIRLVTEQGWADTSDPEWDQGPKETRRTWSGRIEGYVAYRPYEGRLVRSFTVDIEDDTVTPPTEIGEITSGGQD